MKCLGFIYLFLCVRLKFSMISIDFMKFGTILEMLRLYQNCGFCACSRYRYCCYKRIQCKPVKNPRDVVITFNRVGIELFRNKKIQRPSTDLQSQGMKGVEVAAELTVPKRLIGRGWTVRCNLVFSLDYISLFFTMRLLKMVFPWPYPGLKTAVFGFFIIWHHNHSVSDNPSSFTDLQHRVDVAVPT